MNSGENSANHKPGNTRRTSRLPTTLGDIVSESMKTAEWIEKTVQDATEKGYTETLMGRRRYIPGLRERNRSLYEAAKRVATNSPVQGTSAELLKVAMINIAKKLSSQGLSTKIILQIHDELVLECPNNELETVEKIVKNEMESVVSWKIPLIANLQSGKNWGKITK